MIADYEGDPRTLIEDQEAGLYPTLCMRDIVVFPTNMTPIVVGKTRKEVISVKAISDFWAFLAEALTYCYQIDNKHAENYGFKIVDHIEEIEKAVQTTVAEKISREPYLLPKSEVDKVFHLESTRSIGKSHICITFHVLDDGTEHQRRTDFRHDPI